jgi:hypothetical protein
MSKSLILTALLILTGCASDAPKYSNMGPQNAKVMYQGESQFPFLKTVYLKIFESTNECQWSDLGYIEINKEQQTLSVPTGHIVQIDVHFENDSAIGKYSSHSLVFFRFFSKAGENYILEIVDHNRSSGFQVYRLESGGKRTEVPYIPLTRC